MVDAETVNEPLGVELDQGAVGGLEDGWVLDADGGQGVDVEEAAVVQLLAADPPVGQAVPLPLQEFLQGKVLGARSDGEGVVVVGDHGLFLAVDDVRGEVDVFQLPTDPVAEHRHQDGLGVGHVEIEPVRVLRFGAAPQHVPQGVVVPDRCGDRHVIGHHVDDDADALLVGCLRQPPEGLLPAALLGDAGVIHDVIAVGGTGGGLQDRGTEQVRDAQRVQVGHPRRGVIEGEAAVQLHPVGRVRYGPVGLHPLHSTQGL